MSIQYTVFEPKNFRTRFFAEHDQRSNNITKTTTKTYLARSLDLAVFFIFMFGIIRRSR